MATPVPVSHIRATQTPSYHKEQRQVGVHQPGTMHHVFCGGAPCLLSPEVSDLG